MAGPTPSVWKIHPGTGELLSADSPTNPRAIVVDSSGTAITTTYTTGFSALRVLSKAWEDRSFNSIRALNRPLAYRYGGRQDAQQLITTSALFQLTAFIHTAWCETNLSAANVQLISAISGTDPPWLMTVGDIGGNAATNNITVTAGWQMEDPNNAGAFSTTIILNKNWQTVTWVFLPAFSEWKVYAVTFTSSGGGSSVAFDANNVAVTGSPFTTLDIESGQGSNLIAGKGSFTAIPAQTKVVNGTPHTFTTDQIALCQSSGGTTSTTMPSPASLSFATAFHGVGPTNGSGYWIQVIDDQGQCFVNPITVNASGAGDLIEDPLNPGVFSASISLAVNGCSVKWAFDGTNWKIVSKHYPTTVWAGDNIRGRRFAQNKGAQRLPPGTPNNTFSQSLASYSMTAPQDLTLMVLGNNNFVSPIPSFNRYIAVVDSSTSTTCVTVLDSWMNFVATLPTSGNFFSAGTGWNTIGYIHAESPAAPFAFYDRLVLAQIGGAHVGVIAIQNGTTQLATVFSGGLVQSKVFSDGNYGYMLVNFSGLSQTFLYRHDEVSGTPGSFAASGNYNTTYAGNIVGDGTYLYVPGIATGTISRVGPSYWQPRTSGGQTVVNYTIPGITTAITGLSYDGRYLWVACGAAIYVVDPTQMAVIAQLGIRGTGQNVAPMCWDGTNMWCGAPGVASGTDNLFIFDPDQIESLNQGLISIYSTFNNPKSIISRVTPGGARIYLVCGDNTVHLVEGSSFSAEYGDLLGVGLNEYNSASSALGTIAEMNATETKFGLGTVNQVDGFTVPLTTTNATVTTIATIHVPITNPWKQLVDVSISVMGVDSSATSLGTSGFYRADFTFSAIYDGVPGSTSVQIYGSTSPQNVRNNGTAVTNSWVASIPSPLNDGSGRVLIQVQGDPTDTVWWTCIGQVQRGH